MGSNEIPMWVRQAAAAVILDGLTPEQARAKYQPRGNRGYGTGTSR